MSGIQNARFRASHVVIIRPLVRDEFRDLVGWLARQDQEKIFMQVVVGGDLETCSADQKFTGHVNFLDANLAMQFKLAWG